MMLFSVARFIRLALFAFAVAFLLWIVMAGLYRAGWVVLSKWLLWIATETFLFGLSLLVLLGVGSLFNTIFQQFKHYCSASAGLHRQLAFADSRRAGRMRLFASKMQQQRYFAEFKRKRLLRADNLKQVQQLSKSLQQDLNLLRGRLPKPYFRQLQKQLNHNARQGNVACLLALHKKIT